MNRKFSRIALSCTSVFALFSVQEAFSVVAYETYLESWDLNAIGSPCNNAAWYCAMTGLPTPSGATQQYQGMFLNLCFADYQFTSGNPNDISGLNFTYNRAVGDVIAYVQAAGGKVKLTFGGANTSYDISANPLLFSNPDSLAEQVGAYVNGPYFGTNTGVAQYFDGVNFDIEDTLPSGQTDESFAAALFTFLVKVKARVPRKAISVTLKSQGWSELYIKYLCQSLATANPCPVDYINFMEYCFWIANPSSPTGYADQIIADLQTYTGAVGTSPGPNASPGWGIPASLIQVGLMPGLDGYSNGGVPDNLSIAQAQSIVQAILTPGAITPGQTFYQGIMAWDLCRDAQEPGSSPPPITGTTPYAYSNAIREGTASTQTTSSQNRRNQSARQGTVSPPFIPCPIKPNPGAHN